MDFYLRLCYVAAPSYVYPYGEALNPSRQGPTSCRAMVQGNYYVHRTTIYTRLYAFDSTSGAIRSSVLFPKLMSFRQVVVEVGLHASRSGG